MEVWLRLLRLTKPPRDIPALAPAYECETFYHVLMESHGWYLRKIGWRESNLSMIFQTVQWLRDNYIRIIDIGELASKIGLV
jgi:AraC-type transcriptional regulator N-terminus